MAAGNPATDATMVTPVTHVRTAPTDAKNEPTDATMVASSQSNPCHTPKSSLSRAFDVIRAAAPDVTEREARQIIENLKSNPRVRQPVPYLTAAIRNGDAEALVAEARDQIAPADC